MPDKLPPLSVRQAAFVREYLLSGNQSEAYAKAGYNPKNAHANATRLMANDGIAAAITKGRARIEKKLEAEFDLRLTDILTKLAHQVTVDRTRLTGHRTGACRYCYGDQHRYQWRTPREFSEAVEMHMLKGDAYAANHPAPEMEGGYGYKLTAKPNPDCPECDGRGISYTDFADVDTMTDAERTVFEGVRLTRDGMQYVLADRTKALEALGRHLGLADKAANETAKQGAEALAKVLSVVIVPAKNPAITSVRPADPDTDA